MKIKDIPQITNVPEYVKCDGCRAQKQELAELKRLVGEYKEMMEVFDHATYIDGHDELLDKLEQACTLANKDSKLDKKTVMDNLLKCYSLLD